MNAISPRPRLLWLLFAFGVATMCAWIYAPALHGQPIWDDNEALFNFPLITSPLSSLSRVWLSHQAPDFWPLHYSWFWLAYRWWGTNPLPYHLTNLLLHVLNTLLWAAILQRLKVQYAWLCALLFAVHPVNTEAVAWIVQFKTLASSAFCLATFYTYIIYIDRMESGAPASSNRNLYMLSVLMFAAALLTKSSIIFAPIVILALTYWRLRDAKLSGLLSLPFLSLATACGLAALLWYKPDHLLPPGEHLDLGPPYLRLARAGWNFWFYLRQALWPQTITFIHPKHPLDPTSAISYAPLVAALVFGFFIWLMRRRWGMGIAAALAYYVLALAPVLGLYGIYFMRYADVADHWQYMALIAPIAVTVNVARKLNINMFIGTLLALTAIFSLANLTQREAAHYQSEEAIWKQTLSHTPDSWLAHNNLGRVLMAQQNLEQAEIHFKQALGLKADFRDAINNLGAVYIEQNKLDDAINYLTQTVSTWPEYAAAQSNLGVALTRKGDYAAAAKHLEQASKLAPEDASYHKNLGYTQHRLGQLQASIASYQRASTLDPKADHFSDLGQLLREAGRYDEALQTLQLALARSPNHALAMANIGFIKMSQGQLPEAQTWLRKAVALNPNSASIHLALATCLIAAGDTTQAENELQAAIGIDPQTPGVGAVAAEIEALRRKSP